MEFTNMEVANMKEPLIALSKEKLPVVKSLEVFRLIRKLDEHLIPIEQLRDSLVTSYGHKMPNGAIRVDEEDEGWSEFNEKLGELMNQVVDIDVKMVDLPTSISMTPAAVMALGKVFTLDGAQMK